VVEAVDVVGVAVVGGPVRPAELELPLVDDAVVARGEDVPLEARGTSSWAMTCGGSQPFARASSSKGAMPKTWSMWPWV
jgi:hypothetical protein